MTSSSLRRDDYYFQAKLELQQLTLSLEIEQTERTVKVTPACVDVYSLSLRQSSQDLNERKASTKLGTERAAAAEGDPP